MLPLVTGALVAEDSLAGVSWGGCRRFTTKKDQKQKED
jgi:hypothetical protein